jgi:hypothetical protein
MPWLDSALMCGFNIIHYHCYLYRMLCCMGTSDKNRYYLYLRPHGAVKSNKEIFPRIWKVSRLFELNFRVKVGLDCSSAKQGDQIVQIFAHRALAYFGSVFRKLQKQTKLGGYFWPRQNLCTSFNKKRIGPHSGRIFSQTHLVTLGRQATALAITNGG